jgi:hypothetical protein
MIQGDSVSPGYCLLQPLTHYAPLPFYDRTGQIFLKNPMVSVYARYGIEMHGPAGVQKGQPGHCDKDDVYALHCKTWPQQARQWLDQQSEGQWPSSEIKELSRRTGCFVVSVGCRGSEYEQFEWRISTSLSERLLILNLNNTQIRCYVLIKMLIKHLSIHCLQMLFQVICVKLHFSTVLPAHILTSGEKITYFLVYHCVFISCTTIS